METVEELLKEKPLYKRNLLDKHRVRVFWHGRKKPGTIISFSDRKYKVQPDGSLKRIIDD